MAGGARLEKFGDFLVIDNLVKTYQGVYSHDDIFEMEVIMIHNMILLNNTLAYHESMKDEIKRKLKK